MTLRLIKTNSESPVVCCCGSLQFVTIGAGQSCQECMSYVPGGLTRSPAFNHLVNNMKVLKKLGQELKSEISKLEDLVK
jgi:hypothetical protein